MGNEGARLSCNWGRCRRGTGGRCLGGLEGCRRWGSGYSGSLWSGLRSREVQRGVGGGFLRLGGHLGD